MSRLVISKYRFKSWVDKGRFAKKNEGKKLEYFAFSWIEMFGFCSWLLVCCLEKSNKSLLIVKNLATVLSLYAWWVSPNSTCIVLFCSLKPKISKTERK